MKYFYTVRHLNTERLCSSNFQTLILDIKNIPAEMLRSEIISNCISRIIDPKTSESFEIVSYLTQQQMVKQEEI